METTTWTHVLHQLRDVTVPKKGEVLKILTREVRWQRLLMLIENACKGVFEGEENSLLYSEGGLSNFSTSVGTFDAYTQEIIAGVRVNDPGKVAGVARYFFDNHTYKYGGEYQDIESLGYWEPAVWEIVLPDGTVKYGAANYWQACDVALHFRATSMKPLTANYFTYLHLERGIYYEYRPFEDISDNMSRERGEVNFPGWSQPREHAVRYQLLASLPPDCFHQLLVDVAIGCLAHPGLKVACPTGWGLGQEILADVRAQNPISAEKIAWLRSFSRRAGDFAPYFDQVIQAAKWVPRPATDMTWWDGAVWASQPAREVQYWLYGITAKDLSFVPQPVGLLLPVRD